MLIKKCLSGKDRLKDADDAEITFYLCTYQDTMLLGRCLFDLRQAYPTSRVIVVSDGDKNPKIPRICEQMSVEFHASEQLYATATRGRRHIRMLKLFLEQPTEFLIKIDTDTKVNRRLKEVPTVPCCFGCPVKKRGIDFIQGGCIGYTREVAEALYTSNVFLDEEIEGLIGGKYGICEDRVSAYGIKKVDYPILRHPEIKSGIKITPERPNQYSIIHPVKLMPAWDKSLVQVSKVETFL